MSNERETRLREQMTRHWLAAESAIRAYVAAAVDSFADREDLVQQVALTVARRFEEFDESRPFLAWGLWLARSRITDYYRAKGRRPRFLSDAILERLADNLLHQSEEVSRRQEALEDCVERLSARSQSLIRMRYREDLKVNQIADLVRSTPASVRVTLFRIRESLAECIENRLAREGEP